MKKFIIRGSIFILPFYIFFLLNKNYYQLNEGDLIRVGYLYDNSHHKSQIIASMGKTPRKYNCFSELNLKKASSFSVMTIGDSFSEQDSLSYLNYLELFNDTISVIHTDRFLSRKSPVQTLISFINGDLFNYLTVDYIVLQTAERHLISRCEEANFNLSIEIDSIQQKIKAYTPIENERSIDFFSDATIKIPLINVLYNFNNNPLDSKTYKTTATKKLFTHSSNDLLFYEDEIKNLDEKNDIRRIEYANKMLNKINEKLSQKGIKLILLVSPDKYDLYYPYISNKERLTKPLFFSLFGKLPKKYIYIETEKILSDNIQKQKNIYYQDDTHWSPIANKIVAKEIIKAINN